MCYMHFSKRGYYHFKTTTTTTKRPDSKCFLTTGKAFTALHLLKCWFQMPSFYIVSNKRTHSRALPVTESVASCFFHSHRQTCGSRGKLSFSLPQTKIRGEEKRSNHGRGGTSGRFGTFSSFTSFLTPTLAVSCSLLGSPQQETLTNQPTVLWLCC